jgi:histidinol-phosphate aminotransferase
MINAKDFSLTLVAITVSRLSLISALAALEDQDYLEECIEQNACVKRKLEQGLTELGYAFIPSAINSVTANFRDQKQNTFKYMLDNGVILRDLSLYGLKNYVRITVGQCKESNVFLDLLSKVSV